MKFSIRENIYGNWYGYAGGRLVEMFVNADRTQEEEARIWLRTRQLEQEGLSTSDAQAVVEKEEHERLRKEMEQLSKRYKF